MGRIAQVEIDRRTLVNCEVPAGLAVAEGNQCVCETGSAQELGRIAAILEEPGQPGRPPPSSRVLRRATLQDQAKAREAGVHARMAVGACERKIADRKLNMQVVSARQSLDMKVITISFVSEEKIQCRDIVRELARELHARVEMKQIGVRDAAGMTGGLGSCGRVLCCSTWLASFETVSVRMAKNQRLSLNPGAISGVCGRLKCCLRFENDCYVELAAGLPRDGAAVSCRDGRGCVVDRNILSRRLRVKFDDGRIGDYDAAEVTAQKAPAAAMPADTGGKAEEEK